MNTLDRQSFTPREHEILAQLPGGTTYQAIARRLGISPHTVDTHMRRLRIKTGATNRTQLVVVAIQLGYLPGRGSAAPDAERVTPIAS
ncbi:MULTISPECIES: response regulator transcription factor [unclassified Streptomyces]|uniref:response regulator transcription factor n=1 Tax=unclassified Streptomyces TaxID=2593676 RepID=UPI00381C38D5